jgi:hypothetical protein
MGNPYAQQKYVVKNFKIYIENISFLDKNLYVCGKIVKNE